MAKLVSIGEDDDNVGGVRSRGYTIRRSGTSVVINYGAIEVRGAGGGRYFWIGAFPLHEKYPGWMNWSYGQGAITCQINSLKKGGAEWQILSALVGRLAQRYPEAVESMHIQFEAPDGTPRHKGSRRRRA